jgi:hypothetical protein
MEKFGKLADGAPALLSEPSCIIVTDGDDDEDADADACHTGDYLHTCALYRDMQMGSTDQLTEQLFT